MNGHIIYPTKFSTDIEKFQEISENEELSKIDLRVFLFLCCRMGSNHLCKIDKAQIATTLNIPKKKVSKAIDKLESEGIIFRGEDDYTGDGYRMCYTGKSLTNY